MIHPAKCYLGITAWCTVRVIVLKRAEAEEKNTLMVFQNNKFINVQ